MGNLCSSKDDDPTLNSIKGLKVQTSTFDQKSPNNSQQVSQCKVVMLGDTAVGKTSITVRYVQNKFITSHIVTVGAQFQQPKIQLKNGNILKLNLWDTAGEEKFRSMLPMYYKDTKGAIVVYDMGKKETFEHLDEWIEALSQHIKLDDIVLFLVGNKKDLDPQDIQVDELSALRYAKKNKMKFATVSAKTGEGVVEVFNDLAEELSKKFKF